MRFDIIRKADSVRIKTDVSRNVVNMFFAVPGNRKAYKFIPHK